MAEYSEHINREFNISNIIVYDKNCDGIQYGYKIIPSSGYVMYDITDKNHEIDPETEEEIPVTYYYRVCHTPIRYKDTIYNWRAVPETEVPSKYIF